MTNISVEQADKLNINLAYQWLMMHNFLKYNFDLMLFSNSIFEILETRVSFFYSDITHIHKHLATKDEIESGAYHFIPFNDYPSILRSCAFKFFNDLHQKKRLEEDPKLLAP